MCSNTTKQLFLALRTPTEEKGIDISEALNEESTNETIRARCILLMREHGAYMGLITLVEKCNVHGTAVVIPIDALEIERKHGWQPIYDMYGCSNGQVECTACDTILSMTEARDYPNNCKGMKS